MMTTKFLTKNRCYTSRKEIIKPKYVIVHSTACGYNSKDRLFNSWNSALKSKSCHGMVDDEGSILTLPLDYRGWHVGSSGNDITVGFEICEPKNIAFTTAAHNKVDTAKYNPKDKQNISDFNKRYENAVEMAAYMCKQTGISADNVICHAEAYKLGIGSNHGDVNHWFPLFGKSMDTFRSDVKAKLAAEESTKTEDADIKLKYVQVGAYSKLANAEAMKKKVKAAGFDAIIKKNGKYFRVQVGAYTKTENAEAMKKKVEAAGFEAYITTTGGTVVSG